MGQRRFITSRQALAAVVMCLLAAALAAGWAMHRRGEHVATAVVMVHPLEGNAYSPGGRGDDLVNLETEAQVLRSDAVARAVLERIGGAEGPSALLASIDVAVPPNTQLLEISARGRDDRTAVVRASAFADVYLQFRRARTESAVFERTSRLEELVGQREGERDAAVKRLDELRPDAPERALIEQQVQEVVVQISSLRAQLAAAQAVSLDPGQVVTPGHVAPGGAWADPVRAGGAAAVLTLLVVVGVAVARAGRAGSHLVQGLADLEDLTETGGGGPALLGVVKAPVRADGVVVARLRSAVLAAGSDRACVVTIAVPGHGRAMTFTALAESLSRARFEVVTVDLTVPSSIAAMTELVLQEAVVDDVLVDAGHFRSRLRPAAPTARPAGGQPDFADLAASAEMARALAELGKRADLVLVRSPAFATPVGRSMLTAATAAVVEVHPRRCTREEVEDVLADAERGSTHVIGFVEVRA